jgi:MFS family permease
MRRQVRSQSVVLYTPAVFLLILIVGISYLGLGFILPLRALYGRELGATSIEIGLMASSFLLAGFLATPFIGWLTDRFRYRSILLVGLAVHSVIVLVYIPVQTPSLLIALRALEGIATACILPPARALMNTLAPPTRQGEALGVLSASQTVGTLIGPAVGSLLASQVGYTLSFVLASLPLVVGAGVTLFFLPAVQSTPSEIRRVSQLPINVVSNLFTRQLILAYLLQLVLLITNGVAASVWSLYMLDRGASLPLIGLSFTTFALPIIFLSPLGGRFSDRHGRYGTLLLGLFLSGSVFCLYSLPLQPLWIIGISVVEGASIAIARGAVDGFLADVMPLGIKGKVQANYSAAGTLGSFLGSTAAGVLYIYAPGVPFLAEGLLYLSVFMLFLFPFMRRLLTVKKNSSVVNLLAEKANWRGEQVKVC